MHAPPPYPKAPACQDFLETFCMRTHSMRNSNQILLGDQTKLEEFLQSRPRHLYPGQIFLSRTLTRDLFMVDSCFTNSVRLANAGIVYA